MADPIIMTALFSEDDQARLDDLRKRWFPPQLNKVPGHVTLFHQLPGEEADAVRKKTEKVCAERPPFDIEASEVILLGGGVAYKLDAGGLKSLRSDLGEAFGSWLKEQDRSGFRPHLTLQNKVTPDTAKACRTVIEEAFAPFPLPVLGVKLWHYRQGPWEPFCEIRLEG